MTFDPYHKWLGIPAEDQPPNHYRLLAINLFEDDLDVIESASDRQMAHVRTFQGGPHSGDSQKLLNELSAAKICLLDPRKRAAYDAELRHRSAAAQESLPPAPPVLSPLPPAPSALPPQPVLVRALGPAPVKPPGAPELVIDRSGAPRSARPRRRRNSGWPIAAAAALSAAVAVGVLVWAKSGAKPVASAPLKPRPAMNPQPDPQPPAPQALEAPTPPTADTEASAQPPTSDMASHRADAEGFVPLFNGHDLQGWKTHSSQPGNWRVENGTLIGSGPAESHLYSDRGNITNFHLRVEARINDGGNSGIYCRSPFGPARPANNPRWPNGYEAQINSTHADANKTGSLYGMQGPLVTIPHSIVRPHEWFTLELIAADNHIVIKINGQMTADYFDSARRFPMGHLALQQYDAQTVVEFRTIEIRENSPPDRLPAVAESAMTKPSAAGVAESLAEKPAAEPANSPPPAAEIAAIAARLAKAKVDHVRDMQQVCDSLETYLDKRIAASARRRAKGAFDAAVQMRLTFDQDGRMPAAAPNGFKQKAAAARVELERAYRTAIGEYASADQTASAAALQDELDRLGDAERIGPFRRELLRNPGCEQPPQGSGIPGWTAIKGPWQRREKDPPPQEGTGYFLPGDCAEGELVQDIDLNLYAPRIDSGKQKFEFKGFVRSFKQQPPDTSRIVVEYRDPSNSKILDAADSGPIANVDAWQLVSDKRLAPAETRWVRVRLISTRYGRGTRENDGYYDGLSFRAVDK